MEPQDVLQRQQKLGAGQRPAGVNGDLAPDLGMDGVVEAEGGTEDRTDHVADLGAGEVEDHAAARGDLHRLPGGRIQVDELAAALEHQGLAFGRTNGFRRLPDFPFGRSRRLRGRGLIRDGRLLIGFAAGTGPQQHDCTRRKINE
jgi:hypothetical protein